MTFIAGENSAITTRRAPLVILFLGSSMFFFLLSGLLQSWGPPDWLRQISYTQLLRFLLAFEFYFLCLSCFLALAMFCLLSGRIFRFFPVFSFSFLPVAVFAVLVLCRVSYQSLRGLAIIADFSVWTVLLVLAVFDYLAPAPGKKVSPGRKKSRLRKTIPESFTLLFFWLSAFLLLVFSVPRVFLIGSRIVCLLVVFPSAAAGAYRREQLAGSGEKTETEIPGSGLGGFSAAHGLSPRETEVLSLLLEGRSNGEIGASLYISLSTVKTHVASLFDKTGTKSRLELAALCRVFFLDQPKG